MKLVSRGAEWKTDHESTPLRMIGFDPHLSSMPFNDVFHNRQSESCPSQLS